jgi:primosomal protein N''
MGAKKKALKSLRRKFPQPRHPKISQSPKRAIEEQDSGVRIQKSEAWIKAFSDQVTVIKEQQLGEAQPPADGLPATPLC